MALRPLTEHDASLLLCWRNLPEVARHMYTDHVISREEHAVWLQRALSRDDAIYWIIVCDGTDIGLASVNEIDRRQGTCSWALYLAEPGARGHGRGAYTTYTILNHAFDELRLRKVSCEALASNPIALAMYERFGFVREGTFREQVLKNDRPVDVHRLGIMRREWQQIRELHLRRLLDTGVLTA